MIVITYTHTPVYSKNFIISKKHTIPHEKSCVRTFEQYIGIVRTVSKVKKTGIFSLTDKCCNSMAMITGNIIDNVFKVLLIGDAGVGKSRYLYLYLSIYLSYQSINQSINQSI
jgi:putative cofactor-binding repeat protein